MQILTQIPRPLPGRFQCDRLASACFAFLTVVLLGDLHSQDSPGAVVEMGSRGVPNLIRKIEEENRAHVAFLGGSITQKATGHSQLVGEWMKERWPDAEFTFTNAGLSSTCSVSGAFRLRRDVLSRGGVDLLVVEFAVNDDQDAGHDRRTAIRGLEGVVRQYLAANPEGEVIVVHFVNPGILGNIQEGRETVSVEAHRAVARHYDLPGVDVGRALADEIAAGRMTWEEDYQDTHPNETGYRFATELITRVIEATEKGAEPAPRVLPEPLDPGSYFGAQIVDPEELSWLGGWEFAPVSRELLPLGAIRSDYEKFQALRSEEEGTYLYHTFTGTMIGAFVLAGPDAGMLEVSIDGGEWTAIDLYHHHSRGLNYPRSVILADDLPRSYHTAAIRVAEERNPESEGNTATILYFQVNQ